MSREIARGEAPDCIDCGACCFSTLPTYLRIDGDDHERLGEDAETFTHFVGHRCYMRVEDGRCAALTIDAAGPRFLCSVYENRPTTCRELEVGSPACLAERHLKGKRPLQAASLLRARLGP